jgi:hypothetical protein
VTILTGASLTALGRRRWGKVAAAALTAWLVFFGLARYRYYLDLYASPVTSTLAVERGR